MEIFIRTLCEPYDKENKGLIHIDHLMESIKKTDKFILSRIQTFIVQSFVEKDEDGMVNYFLESRILSEIIKKFFTPALINK